MIVQSLPSLKFSPTSMQVTVKWANTVIAVLEKHVASGGTVIAASHDPEVAKAADFVIEVESALSKTQ